MINDEEILNEVIRFTKLLHLSGFNYILYIKERDGKDNKLVTNINKEDREEVLKDIVYTLIK